MVEQKRVANPKSWQYKLLVAAQNMLIRSLYQATITGSEHLITDRPVILVSNHQSYLDVPLLTYLLTLKNRVYDTFWICGKNSISPFLFDTVFRYCPLIMVNGVVTKAEAALKAGSTVVIFPEGYYTWHRYRYIRMGKDPNLLKKIVGNSAAILSLKTGCPIIPIGLHGTEQAYPPYALLPKPGKVEVRIGAPFTVGKPDPEEMNEEIIREKTRLVIQQLDALR